MKSQNHIFRTIWSEALGVWVAVSEIAKSKGKRSVSSLLRLVRIDRLRSGGDLQARLKPVLFTLACCFALNAQANPIGGAVVNGQASFNTSGNTLTVTNTPGTIINWQGFSIGANEVTHFAQQSASSTVLNHVVTNNPSVILGTLSSNGQVYLVNANGIMFGAGSTVDVAGLVATTLNLSDADFLAGRHNYTAVPGAQNISNAGNINAQQGGQIYLIAPNVENNGVIKAPNGEILLAAGNSVELVNSNDPNLRVKITAPAGDATNLGQLIVGSGSLGLFGTMVRNSGIVSADSATMQGGKIVFRASQNTEVRGTVSATGTTGGNIEILGDQVALLGNASVDASGVNGGGTVLVGGDAHGANQSVQNAQITYVDATATIKADALQNGNGGKVVVWSDNLTQFNGNIFARGGALSGNGGWVETSGKQWLGFAGLVDTTAAHGMTGSLLLDPVNITISAAINTPSMNWNGGAFTFADTSTGGVTTSNLNVNTLTTQLNLTNVTVDTTNAAGLGVGNIDVQSAISWASANSLTLNATGSGAITTNAAITNTGTGGLTMQTGGGGITLNAGVTLAGGSFIGYAGGAGTINIGGAINTGTGAVNLTAFGSSINETGLGLISTTGTLTTSSYSGTTLNGANSVGTFQASNGMAGNISLMNAAPWLTITGISNSIGGVSVTNAGVISISGSGGATVINAGAAGVNLTTTGTSGWIREAGGVIATTGTLTINNSSSSGTSLNGGTNMVSTLNATDVGMVYLQNGTALNVTGIAASDVLIFSTGSIATNGAVTASNAVDITGVGISNNSTITGNLGVSLNAGTGMLSNFGTAVITNGGGASTGAIALTADAMVLMTVGAGPGTVEAGAGLVKVNTSTLTHGIDLGSTTDVGNLVLELSNAELASINTTGSLSIGGASTSGAINVSQALSFAQDTELVNGSGGIAINNAIAATGRDLTLNSSGTVTQAASISATGLELLGGGTFVLNDPANSFMTVAGNVGSLSLVDSGSFSIGTVNTVGLTATGAISLTSAGAISQTSAIMTPGLLTTVSSGGTTLNGANTISSINSTNSTSGDISLINSGSLDIAGMDNSANGGSITVVNTGSIGISGAVMATGGAINLSAAGSIIETGPGYISTTGLLTTASVSGLDLSGGNLVNSFNATNSTSGNLNLINGETVLTVTGLSQHGGGGVNINNFGDLITTGAITTSAAPTAVTLTTYGSIAVGNTITGSGGALNLILNHGSIGSAAVTSSLSLLGGSLDVQSIGTTGTGTLDISAGVTLNSGSLTAATLVNNGSIFLSGTGSSVTGILTQNGLLDIAAGGTLTTSSFTNTGTLSGGGALNLGSGTVTNNGIIAPGGVGTAGTLTISGNLVMGATGAVNVDISSALPGNYDILNVTGTATLTGGTMNIVGGAEGSFDVLNAAGGFGGTKFAAINSGVYGLTSTYTANTLDVDLKLSISEIELSELVENTLIVSGEEDDRKRGPHIASSDSRRGGATRADASKMVCR